MRSRQILCLSLVCLVSACAGTGRSSESAPAEDPEWRVGDSESYRIIARGDWSLQQERQRFRDPFYLKARLVLAVADPAADQVHLRARLELERLYFRRPGMHWNIHEKRAEDREVAAALRRVLAARQLTTDPAQGVALDEEITGLCLVLLRGQPFDVVVSRRSGERQLPRFDATFDAIMDMQYLHRNHYTHGPLGLGHACRLSQRFLNTMVDLVLPRALWSQGRGTPAVVMAGETVRYLRTNCGPKGQELRAQHSTHRDSILPFSFLALGNWHLLPQGNPAATQTRQSTMPVAWLAQDVENAFARLAMTPRERALWRVGFTLDMIRRPDAGGRQNVWRRLWLRLNESQSVPSVARAVAAAGGKVCLYDPNNRPRDDQARLHDHIKTRSGRILPEYRRLAVWGEREDVDLYVGAGTREGLHRRNFTLRSSLTWEAIREHRPAPREPRRAITTAAAPAADLQPTSARPIL